MKINIYHLREGALKAKGLTVIIDVFRAFSTACYLYDRGANLIIPVNNIEQAYSLKQEHPDYLLVGERGGEMVSGFDYGNSPSAIVKADFCGKTVVLTTSSGTLGLYNALNADEIITGSFVNAGAIVSYITAKQPPEVSLVCMGLGGNVKADEDIFLAEYIAASLNNSIYNFEEKVELLKNGSGKRFFDNTITHSPAEDFELCLQLNRFDFVLQYCSGTKYGYLRKVSAPY